MLSKRIRTCIFLLVVIICIDCVFVFSLEKDTDTMLESTKQLDSFEKELEYFPIAQSSTNTDLTVSFVDTWNSSRNYGGERLHEGCDIITSHDRPGIYPIVSISDGVIENVGWLELGGYRIGIRTNSGYYLYYAHLESYAPGIEEGKEIHAGECIGFVGNTGYGEEGTTGMFVTHLHLGFYEPNREEDIAFNPYPYLVKLQKKQLKYKYEEP